MLEVDLVDINTTINPSVLQPSIRNDPNQAPSMDFIPSVKKTTPLHAAKSPITTKFANLSQAADDSDEIRDFDDQVVRPKEVVPASKRKRENQLANAQDTEKSRPIRRTVRCILFCAGYSVSLYEHPLNYFQRTATRNQTNNPPTEMAETICKVCKPTVRG